MTETTGAYVKGVLYSLPVADLLPDPHQPRKIIEAQSLDELTASVARFGVLEPILFRQDPATKLLYIVAGERRFLAARKAGLSTIPAILVDENATEIAVVENLLRQDLTAVEEAEALQTLMTDRGYTQEQLGGMLGKAQNTVSEILTLNKLPQAVRDDARGNRQISRTALLAIAKKKQARAMQSAYDTLKAKLAAAAKPKKPREKTSPCNAMLKLLDTTKSRIFTLDTRTWSTEEKNTVQSQLQDLQSRIADYLNRTAGERPPIRPM